MMEVHASDIKTEVFISDESNHLIIKYMIKFTDNSSIFGTLEVTYSFALNDSIDCSIMENYVNIFLSQMFLSNGEITLVGDEKDIIYYSSIINALYAIRNYQEKTRIPAPYIRHIFRKSSLNRTKNNGFKVLNLISGGKDSLVSDILLEQNDAIITRCFLSGLNIASSINEELACHNLYENFERIELKGFDVLIHKLEQLSNLYGKPPEYNYIPKGRDLLAIILAYPVANKYGCKYIAHSCEKDLWENNIIINEMEIPLNDSQSSLVIIPMSRQLESSLGIRIFSPIAGMHEIYILTWLMKEYPEKVKLMQSCFYENWCGKCFKCLRYYLVQRWLRLEIINFNENPELYLPSFLDNFEKSEMYIHNAYYKQFKLLTGENDYMDELMTPTSDKLFPDFFGRWKLE